MGRYSYELKLMPLCFDINPLNWDILIHSIVENVTTSLYVSFYSSIKEWDCDKL
jgi:hypothetical protein